MRWWTVVAVVLVGLLTSTSRADDPPAKAPPRHENKVTPEAQAAIEKLRGLVYRAEDHCLASIKGDLVSVGTETAWRLPFEFEVPGFVSVTRPPGFIRECKSAGMRSGVIASPFRSAYYPDDVIDWGQFDAEVTQHDGKDVVRLTTFDGDRCTGWCEVVLDEKGLATSYRRHEQDFDPADQIAPDVTITYAWSGIGDLHCVRAVEIVLGGDLPGRYVCEIAYADAAGVHFPSSVTMTCIIPGHADRKLVLYADGVVLNGAAVDLPRPWKHVNKVTPEAKAAIERYAALVDRPADHGLKSLTASLLAEGASAPKWKLEHQAGRGTVVSPVAGFEPTPAQSFVVHMQLLMPLEVALTGTDLFSGGEYDAEYVDRAGERVLSVMTFRDGGSRTESLVALLPNGLIGSLRTLVDPSRGLAVTSTFGWEPVGTRHRLRTVEIDAGDGRQSMRFRATVDWAEVNGLAIVTSFTTGVVASDGDKRIANETKIRLVDLVVNGRKAEVPAPVVHRNEISAEAKAALERLAGLVDRTSDHGLKSMKGTFAPGGLAFEFGAGGIQVWSASAQPDPRDAQFAEIMKLLLLVAHEGPPVRGDREYDAAFEDRLGAPVLVVTVFRDGRPLERREAVLDETGLVRSLRFVNPESKATVSEMQFGWTAAGSRWQVTRAELWTPQNALHVRISFGFAEVGGIRAVTSVRFAASNLGPQFDGKSIDFVAKGLTVNGRAVETPTSNAHQNVVSAEAAALLAAHAKKAPQPRVPGLASASGTVSVEGAHAGGTYRFSFAAPAFVYLAPAAATAERDSAAPRVRFALFVTVSGLPLVESLEYDARVLTSAGARVLEVVEYRLGARVSTAQFTFGADGMIETRRRTEGPGEPGQATDTCIRMRWEGAADGSRLAGCVVTTGAFDAVSSATWTFGYAEVSGLVLPVSFRVVDVAPGASAELDMTVRDLVVNGKRVSASPGAK